MVPEAAGAMRQGDVTKALEGVAWPLTWGQEGASKNPRNLCNQAHQAALMAPSSSAGAALTSDPHHRPRGSVRCPLIAALTPSQSIFRPAAGSLLKSRGGSCQLPAQILPVVSHQT